MPGEEQAPGEVKENYEAGKYNRLVFMDTSSAELGYALFGSSRHLAIGPTSAISLMVGASVAPLALGNPVRFAQLATSPR